MPVCSNCGSQTPEGSHFCPNCGAQLSDSQTRQSSDVELTKSFERELGIPESEASELYGKFKLKMTNPPCPYCGAPFAKYLQPSEEVTCPHCRNTFLVEDSASKAIGDILKEDQKMPEQAVQKAQLLVRTHLRGRVIQRRRAQELVTLFREKGATSPEKALTLRELGLPPPSERIFERAMQRRLGRLGIFIEVNGRYYLDEKRLAEVREQMANQRRLRHW